MVQTWTGFIKTDDWGFMSSSSQSNRMWAVWTPGASRPLPTVLPGLQGVSGCLGGLTWDGANPPHPHTFSAHLAAGTQLHPG